MTDQASIRQAVDILIREANPTRIILFGSHARGDAGPDSDVDLLVVSQQVASPRREMARLRRALSPLRIPADVIVADEATLSSSWADFPGSCLYDALREGKVVYAMDGPGAPAAPEG
ncbi:MAG: nucleotidyltransferase domain-containing protein [Armatimonadetes bacterium]|nr:nucleotidyltransferase domain-containing protein [Armatimonadota bacterium]